LLDALNYNISDSDILKNLKITKDIFSEIEVLGEKPENFNLKKFKFPYVRKLDLFPKSIVRILGKLLWVKASIDKKKCVQCMLCVKSCPAGAIQASNDKYLCINMEKCISCFCCHEMCPQKAIQFKKSILAKIFINEN
jgi:ferredoxin